MEQRDPVTGKFVSQLAVGFLGAYVRERGGGLLGHGVGAKLERFWTQTKAELADRGSAADLLARFENDPDDPLAREALEAEIQAAAEEDDEYAEGVGIVVDADVQALWISDDTGIELGTVERVLDVEWEFMVGVGIADEKDRAFLYYKRDELARLPLEVDVARVAQDAARFLGVPLELAIEVLESETKYLEVRGLAGFPEGKP